MNSVNLLGRLTKDIDFRTTNGGKNVARFTIAVNRKFKKEEADFLSCVAFGKTAEIMAQYLHKGDQVGVSGSIQTGSYEAQDGTKKYTTDIIVDSFTFCSTSQKTNKNTYDSINNNDIGESIKEEEIPF